MREKLHVRRARPEDREAVLSFCAHTWEHGDYIGAVWEDWLTDERGPLLVAVLGGRPVGVAKVTPISSTEAWFEGMRVDPEYRRQGIATAVVDYLLDWAVTSGVRVARLSTAADNVAVHKIIEQRGFRRMLSSPYYVAEALTEGEAAERLSPEAEKDVWMVLRRWGRLERGRGFYCWRWGWQPLTPERLRGHLHAGHVLGVHDGGALAAVAIVEESEDEDDGLFVGFLDGEAESLRSLALALRVLAAHCRPPKVEAMPLDEESLLNILEEAGYQRGWGPSFWVYEAWLEEPGNDGKGGSTSGSPPGSRGGALFL